jgi:hypothetical protein
MTKAAALVVAATISLVSPSSPPGTEPGTVREELARGLEELRLENSAAPYHAEVRIVRADLLALTGRYGGVITDIFERQAAGTVEVRVGSSDRDDSGYFGADTGLARFEVPLQAAPNLLRKKVWLAMDAAFRGATKAYAQKQSILDRLAGDPPPPDLGPPPAAVERLLSGQSMPTADIDRKGLAGLAAALSARFEDHPEIDNGEVHVQVMRTQEVVLTSDGVALEWLTDRAVLAVVAETRAPDGMQLDHGRAIHLQAIPTANAAFLATGEALVDRVLTELEELARAPMLDEDYDGPILWADEAAAQLLATTVATQASGVPAPLSELGRMVDIEPAWQGQLGKTVMPTFVDIWDDPTGNGFGSFDYDAQGFVPEPIHLVERGKLRTLLMTRTPNDRILRSNARARMSPALTVGSAISNLTLSSRRRRLSRAALEREVLRRAREDGYEFAYVIESLRDGIVLGPVIRETAGASGSARKIELPLPARIRRITSGGGRTLVRGALFSPVSMRVLRRIRAVGRRPNTVVMRIPVGALGGFGIDVGMDGVLSQTVDVQVTTPSLLIDGFELIVERGEHERMPTLVHPLRRTESGDPQAGG